MPAELVQRLAALLGSHSAFMPVAGNALAAAGIEPREVSLLFARWMSLRPRSGAGAPPAGFRHLPLDEYLGRIAAAFLAQPPPAPPDGYSERAKGDSELGAAIRV